MKTVVIWDWDNTLADTKKAVWAGLQDLAEHFSLPPVTLDDLENVMGVHRGDFWQRNFGADLMVGINYYINHYPKYTHLVELCEGVTSVLDFVLQKQIPQIILSNKAQQNLIKEVSATNLEEYFVNVTGSDEEHGGKPEKRFADYALSGLEYDRLILIGDGISDMQMAQILGAVSIYLGPEELSDYPIDYRCQTLKEVQDILSRLL